jgi:hypothetical protein
MDAVPLPLPEDVRALLGDLTNRVVAVEPSRTIDIAALPLVARYESDNGQLLAVAAWDVGLAAAVGGALAMVPKAQIEEAVQTGALSELLDECFREVTNIASRWLHSGTTPHLRLARVATGWAEDERALLETGTTCAFAVELDGYGAGTLACVALR